MDFAMGIEYLVNRFVAALVGEFLEDAAGEDSLLLRFRSLGTLSRLRLLRRFLLRSRVQSQHSERYGCQKKDAAFPHDFLLQGYLRRIYAFAGLPQRQNFPWNYLAQPAPAVGRERTQSRIRARPSWWTTLRPICGIISLGRVDSIRATRMDSSGFPGTRS